jgi:hypothetical protein
MPRPPSPLADVGRTYPHIVAIAVDVSGGEITEAGPRCDEQFEFEFALDLLLDGFERLHDAGWSSLG